MSENGYSLHAARGPKGMSKPLFRVDVALVRRGVRWLVALRRPDAHLPGLWEFPGGKCESQETPDVAAIRELHEECGVSAVAERVLTPVCYEYADRRVHITPVLCRWQSGEARPLGSDECRWVTWPEMRGLEMPPVNTEIIRQIEQLFSSP
jgi:8-oxo-dGTP diphosphatase